MPSIDELEPVQGDDGHLVNRYEISPETDDYPFARIFVDTIPDRNKCIVKWHTTQSVIEFLDSIEGLVDNSESYGQFTKPHPKHTDEPFTGTIQGLRSHRWFPDHYSYVEAPFKEYFGGVSWTTADPPQITVSVEDDSSIPIFELFEATFWGSTHLSENITEELRLAIGDVLETDCTD